MARKARYGILEKGEVVDDTYEVQFFIGEGAFGEVYRVIHRHLGIQVMKVLKDEYVANTDLEIVTKEAMILAKLTHPNVVRVFETNSFVKDGREHFYITLGFVSGEVLTHLLERKGQLPLVTALSIQTDVLKGLSFVQGQTPPIVHRDINTDNILLSYESKQPVALLSDFGLSQSIDQFSGLPGAAGRYPYFAPECFFGTYLPASDVFSAGIVMYQMITGKFPWDYDFGSAGDDPDQIATMIMSSRKKTVIRPSEISDECDPNLDNVILKALSKDIEGRYKTSAEFLGALNNWNTTTVLSAKLSSSTTDPEIPSNSNLKRTPFTVKVPGKGFDEIAGMDDLKESLYNDVILPLSDKELYESYKVSIPNGMLLYGPPGCGKTFFARKFSEEIDYNFVEIKPSDLASIYVHGTQGKIAEVFSAAKNKAPTILFIDEVDAILPNREGDLSQSYASEVNEFLAQMTECHKSGIFIIAATNRPEKIDPAILRTGRMDKVVYLPPPDFSARIAMFNLHLQGRPTSGDICVEELAELTNYFVASDILFLVNEASRNALKERMKIEQRHLLDVIHGNSPSISERQLRKYEIFRNNRSFN